MIYYESIVDRNQLFNVKVASEVFKADDFTRLFPNADERVGATYDNLMDAISYYPAFCGEFNDS